MHINSSSIVTLLYRMYEDRPDDSIEKCALLLDEPSLDTAVRVGDVYGMMIEHYAHTGNHQKVCVCVCVCVYECMSTCVHL